MSNITSAAVTDAESLLTPSEVAQMFRVDPKTVTRWAKAGKLNSIRTLGGHRRYRETEVRALLTGAPDPAPTQAPPKRAARTVSVETIGPDHLLLDPDLTGTRVLALRRGGTLIGVAAIGTGVNAGSAAEAYAASVRATVMPNGGAK